MSMQRHGAKSNDKAGFLMRYGTNLLSGEHVDLEFLW
jgi:hypothetical protein